MSTTITHIT